MPDPALALELTHVEKRYGKKVHALKGVSLNVRRGEIFGLLGPNGAGKSTLVKVLMTVVKPTRAEGWVLGEPVATKAALRQVGYLPENHRFPRYLTGRQTLDFFASLSGADRAWRRRTIPQLLDVVGMTPWADEKIGRYSKGMMQRVGIAQALSADPQLVVLDEPTDGVDPVGRRDIRDVLLRMKSEGKTVFINSHLLSELELVCDRVAIMVGGQVVRMGTVSELAGASRRTYEIEVEPLPGGRPLAQILGFTFIPTAPAPTLPSTGGPPAIPVIPILAAAGATNLPAVRGTLADGRSIEVSGNTLRIGEEHAAGVQPLIDRLRAEGVTIRRIAPVQPNLEQLFMEAVSESSGGDRYVAGATLR